MALADALADHPARPSLDFPELNRAIEAMSACATTCSVCADSHLGENAAAMADCIRHCLRCADLCSATARILSRPTLGGHAWERVVAACAAVCAECAAECERHDHATCRECAAACRACERACQALLAAGQEASR